MKKNDNKNASKLTKGGRNLILLGIISTLIALGTTGVSLAIYHNTGDIYLDRSRPGFLPDQDEIAEGEENQDDDDYNLDKSGELTTEILNEYLKELNEEIEAIDVYDDAFNETALSNEKLNIPKPAPSQP